ncbi:MAG: Crp/Fnr family transcriptional regulator [Rhodocyclaceae bacterium]|nr:Crp/Fnr family transcriptional regulator [Rhodocyclaceae bacterium]
MPPQKTDISAVLRQLPLFQELTPEQTAHLVAGTREKRLQKGEMLFQKGDKPRGFFLMVSGQVKLAFSSPQGNEKVVHILGPNQTFGEAVMFMDRPYPVFAQALTDAVLLHVGQAEVFQLLQSDPLFARHLLAGLSIRLHTLVQDVESYSLRSSAERVIGYLLQGQTETKAGSSLDVDLPTSKQVIASLLNLTPETLSRIFHDLSSAGLITVQGKHVHVPDVARLARYQP